MDPIDSFTLTHTIFLKQIAKVDIISCNIVLILALFKIYFTNVPILLIRKYFNIERYEE